MPVLGLVLVLDDATEATRERAVFGLTAAPGLELGDPAGHRWPAVLEADTPRDAEARIGLLRRLPGVANVDVVFADFEDLTSTSRGTSWTAQARAGAAREDT